MTSEPEIHDLVSKGGCVVDPAQKMDGVADVAIRDGRVAAVAPALPPHRAARTENDVRRLRVSPRGKAS